MNHNRLLPFLLALFSSMLSAQLVVPDTVCTNEVFGIDYTGPPATSYCIIPNNNALFQEAQVEVVGDFPEGSFPLFAHPVVDGNDHFIFTTLSLDGHIVRSDFGDNFSNEPTNTILELSDIPDGQEGIQIIYDDGNWWGFVVGGNNQFFGPEYLARLDFGNSLYNTPSVENLGNILNLRFPHDIFIVKENDNWIGLTINRSSNAITRIEFGDRLGNVPRATNLGNVGMLNNPTGFYPIQVDGAWHLFIVNTLGHSISRVDFGNSLLNTPSGENLGGEGFFDRPRDMIITQLCDNYFGLVGNQIDGEISVIGFGNNIMSDFFVVGTENFEGIAYPHSFTSLLVTQSGITTFIVDVARSKLNRVSIPTTAGTVGCDSDISQLLLSYDEPGIYTLQLATDVGLPSQVGFCKDIVVLRSPSLDLGPDTILCDGETLTIETAYPEIIWQDDTEGSSYEISDAGTVRAVLTEDFCSVADTIQVGFSECSSCYYVPNVFAPDLERPDADFTALQGCDTEILDYEMVIYNRWGEMIFFSNDDSVTWGGRFQNHPCPPGVYVWKLSFVYESNDQVIEEIETGNVTLIR